MKRLLLALLSPALSLPLGAAEQFLDVTPENLDGWTVTGADKSTLASGTQLTLPAGVQLYRGFPNGAVILHLAARPVFSEAAAEWPIVGVGSATLTFVRKDGEGRLVLVMDESTTKELPWSVPLEGKPETAVELVLAYDGLSGVGLIGWQDQVRLFEASPSGQPTEVLLSTGAKSPWPLDLMQVMLLTTGTEDAGKPAGGGTGSAKQDLANKLQTAGERLLGKGKGVGTPGWSTKVSPDKAVGRPVSVLEVFTPPSVRRTRVIAAVQGTLAGSQGK